MYYYAYPHCGTYQSLTFFCDRPLHLRHELPIAASHHPPTMARSGSCPPYVRASVVIYFFMGLLRTIGENEVAWLAGWSYHICERMLVFLDGRPGRSS